MNNTASKNERWSAVGSSSEHKTKSSDRLQQILYRQDFAKAKPAGLPRPCRRASVNSIGSMSSMSSMNSFGNSTINSINSTSIFPSSSGFNSINNNNKASKNNLMRYCNIESKNSLLSLNNRWNSIPSSQITSNKHGSAVDITNMNNMYQLNSSVLSPLASGNHNGRWLASVDGENSKSDQPINMIRRKSSSYLFPTSA